MSRLTELINLTDKWALGVAKDPSTEDLIPLTADQGLGGAINGLNVFLHIFNPTTLDWEKYKGVSVYAENLTISMDDMEKLAADFYFQRVKIYYDGSNNAEYVCKNTDIDANETDTDWYCWKLVYDGSNNMTDKEGPRQGAVNVAPTGLGWNI